MTAEHTPALVRAAVEAATEILIDEGWHGTVHSNSDRCSTCGAPDPCKWVRLADAIHDLRLVRSDV